MVRLTILYVLPGLSFRPTNVTRNRQTNWRHGRGFSMLQPRHYQKLRSGHSAPPDDERNRRERYRRLLLNFDDGRVRQALLDKVEEIGGQLDDMGDDE